MKSEQLLLKNLFTEQFNPANSEPITERMVLFTCTVPRLVFLAKFLTALAKHDENIRWPVYDKYMSWKVKS